MTCFTPEMAWICSSTGSRTCFSTMSGEAPGYTMPTETKGGATSGNSSVLSFSSAKMPKTASANIDTTVISGRLMAKSEMNMGVAYFECPTVIPRSEDSLVIPRSEATRDLHFSYGCASFVAAAPQDRNSSALGMTDVLLFLHIGWRRDLYRRPR